MAVKESAPGPDTLGGMVEIEVRLFNSLARYAPGRQGRFALRVARPATVRSALARLAIPRERIFVLWLNGRNLKEGVGFTAAIDGDQALVDGDVLALSGPVPYSTAYGTPVC